VTLRRILVSAALLTYPADFRAHYREDILADIDADPSRTGVQLLDLVKGAVLMHLDAIARDFSYALRRLRSAPLFVAIVVLAFALGIGANVAVFSVLDAVVLRPLPFVDPSSLGVITSIGPRGDVFPVISAVDALDIASRSHTLEGVAASASFGQRTLLLRGKPYALHGLRVSTNYLSLLGITPRLGRGFTIADGKPGMHAAIISDELWRKRFAADPGVIGTAIMLDGKSYRVIGVLAPGQLLADPNGERVAPEDLLEALPANPPATQRGARMMGGIVRLAPGITIERANAELKDVSANLTRAFPDTNKGFAFFVQPLSTLVLGKASSSLWIVFAAVVGILLIACANVGNMLAARWSVRERELAVRRALGASSRRIAGQLFNETGLLASIGAVFGVGFAYGALQLLGGILMRALPRAQSIAIDGNSLLYAIAIGIVATLLAGLGPVLSLRSSDLQSVLKSAGRGGDGSRRHRLRAAFVVIEVALAIALVIVSGLMLRSFLETINAPLGIDANGVVVSEPIELPQTEAPDAVLSTQRELLRRLRALPGVESAALALFYPISDIELESSTGVFGRTYARGQEPLALANAVSSQYFAAFGVRPLRGRAFTDDDTVGSAPVAIVSERFVQDYLAGIDPLKARIRIQTGPTQYHWAAIVGVVPDQRVNIVADAFGVVGGIPEYYAPLAQLPQSFFAAIVRAPGLDPTSAGREVQSAFTAVIPSQPPPEVSTISQRIANDTVKIRLTTILLAALGAIALALALSGIFGVVSFSVTQRVREFGVRIALGATTRTIVADVLRRALATTAIGVACGVIITAFAARAIAPQLQSISPFDPATFATVVVLVFLSALLASLQPALRATRVEPAESLRYE